MSDNDGTVRYDLIKPFPYSNKGETLDAAFIELTAPTAKNLYQCADLKQSFFRAIAEHGKNEDAENSKEDLGSITPEELIAALYASSTVDMKVMLGTAIELFKSGVAMADGEIKLTKPLLDEMSTDDLEGMLGTYMLNFILASSLKLMK